MATLSWPLSTQFKNGKEQVMLGKKQLWDLATETMQAFAPFYREAMQKAIQDSGAPDNWFFLNLARASDPAPVAVEHLDALFPYTAPQRYTQALEELAQLELLERVGENAYRLTDLGREAVEDIFQAAHQELEKVEPLPPDEMDQLNSLLCRLVEATLEAPRPLDKRAIASSRWTDPGEGAHAAVKADQYLTDLFRFRDDAHLAAWRPYEVSGVAWEALTLIWRDEAHTAAELAERLSFRAYTVEDYEEALQGLAARGWIAEEEDHYKLTAQGAQIREEAEETTDRHFYTGWSALSGDELAQLESLLARANEKLQALTLERIWGLSRELSGAIPAAVRETTAPLIEQRGLNEPGYYFLLLTAKRLQPDAIWPGWPKQDF
jgi:Mn-dependent DtxR family transcriptional regulator